jgi:hypothetical protein
MIGRPSAADLLQIAGDTVNRELMASLPAEKRHIAIMVANALAQAGREIGVAGAATAAELALLAELFGEATVAGSGTDAESRLTALNGLLARSIRAGRFDDVDREKLHKLFRCQVAHKLGISNPRYLKSYLH